MCIRDRYPKYKRYQVEDFIAFFKISNDYKEYTVLKLAEIYNRYIKGNSNSVSYTHPDVYKRQGICSALHGDSKYQWFLS